MTINDWDRFKASLPDWGMLAGCFGQTRIAPTDVDGLVEVNGKFLLLEWKSPGVKIKRGQSRTFDHLVALGCFTVLILWGTPGIPEQGQRWPLPPKPCDLDGLRRVVSAWYRSSL